MAMLINAVHLWLQEKKVRKVVCCVSCVAGLFCAFFSSSFKDLLEKWKIVVYILFYVVLLLFVLWSTFLPNDSICPETKVGRIILVLGLVITSVYTYFIDEKVEVKPDVYILVSYSALAIMSLFLSSLSHSGFGDELLYFFTCTLIIQLMKIKWWLFIVGGIFMYFLVGILPILIPTLRRGSQRGYRRGSRELGDPNPAAGNMDNLPQELNVHSSNEDEVGLLTAGASSSQEAPGNEGNNGNVPPAFSVCLEALKKENDRVIDKVYQHALDNNARAGANLVDKNLVVNSLQLNDLQESAQLMIKEGSEEKCLQEYTRWQREFLDIILSRFPPPLVLEMEDIQNEEKIQGWVKTLTVAVRILFPNEMTLCRRVFGSHNLSDSAFVDVCRELANQIIDSSYAVATWSHFIPNTLQQLLQELDTVFRLIPAELSSFITDQVNQVRIILANSEQLKSDLTNDNSANVTDAYGIHSITRQVMNYIGDEFKNSDDSFLGRCFEKYATAAKQGKLSPSALVETIIKKLENSLKATSESFETSLGCVFIMINRTFIAREIERLGLKPIIGDDWLTRNQDEIEQNLQLYLSSSWDETLKFLNVDFIEFATSEDLEDSMAANRSSFNLHFDAICKDMSRWIILDDNLRVQIKESIKKKLLPAYEKFMIRYQELSHRDYYMNIVDPALHGVEDKLNNLFPDKAGESDDAPKEEKKNV